MNSEIARANCISEIDRLGAVRSPSLKAQCAACGMGLEGWLVSKIAIGGTGQDGRRIG